MRRRSVFPVHLTISNYSFYTSCDVIHLLLLEVHTIHTPNFLKYLQWYLYFANLFGLLFVYPASSVSHTESESLNAHTH